MSTFSGAIGLVFLAIGMSDLIAFAKLAITSAERLTCEYVIFDFS